MPGSIHAYVTDGARLHVQVVSDQGARLALSGHVDDLQPGVDEGGALEQNPALRTNLWAYAKTWYVAHTVSKADALSAPDPETQRAALKLVDEARELAEKRAEEYKKVAQWIADVADDVSLLDVVASWCSSCFGKHEHRKSNRPVGQLPAYVCGGCGSPTLPCVAIGCDNMAVRDRGAIRFPQFCAEHRHAIPGFEKAQGSFGELHDYEEYLEYDQPNLDRVSKIAVGGLLAVGVAVPLTLLAAPAIGGAIGSLEAGRASSPDSTPARLSRRRQK